MIEDKVFLRFKADFSKLERYGFVKTAEGFVLKRPFMDDAFVAVVSVRRDGTVEGDVSDADTGDAYLPLRVETGAGGFAERVRNAYKAVLEDVRDNCFVPKLFAGDQANRIARKIFETYGDAPAFPWEKYDDYGVFRNPETAKWYGLIMNIDGSKLDPNLSGAVDVMNLKISADKIPELVKEDGLYPAYHMNKKYWISVALNDTLPDETVMGLVAESYAFSRPKRKRG